MQARKFKILCIDDERALLEWYTAVLPKRLGGDSCQIVTAYGNDTARNILSNEPVDLIISDINRPGMNGLDFYDSLWQGGPKIKIIFVSGSSLEYRQQRIKKVYCFAWLLKPIEIDELIDTVKKALPEFFGMRSSAPDLSLYLPGWSCLPQSAQDEFSRIAQKLIELDRKKRIFMAIDDKVSLRQSGLDIDLAKEEKDFLSDLQSVIMKDKTGDMDQIIQKFIRGDKTEP